VTYQGHRLGLDVDDGIPLLGEGWSESAGQFMNSR